MQNLWNDAATRSEILFVVSSGYLMLSNSSAFLHELNKSKRLTNCLSILQLKRKYVKNLMIIIFNTWRSLESQETGIYQEFLLIDPSLLQVCYQLYKLLLPQQVFQCVFRHSENPMWCGFHHFFENQKKNWKNDENPVPDIFSDKNIQSTDKNA